MLGLPPPWAKESGRVEKLLIVGGGSNCGKFAVQLSKLAGIQKIIVIDGHESQLKALGATDVIDRHGEEDAVVKKVRAVVGDDLVYAFDAVNMPDGLGLAFKALSGHTKGKLARLVRILACNTFLRHFTTCDIDLRPMSIMC